MLLVLGRAERYSLAGIAGKRRRQRPMSKTMGTNTTNPSSSAVRLARLLVVILANITIWAQAENPIQASAGPAKVIFNLESIQK